MSITVMKVAAYPKYRKVFIKQLLGLGIAGTAVLVVVELLILVSK